MIQPKINQTFSSEFIANFIINNDSDDIFSSAKLNVEEFVEAVRRLNNIDHIIVFEEDGVLKGVFGYYFVNEDEKHKATKAIWRLPDNLTDGDVLYLAFILTIEKCDLWATKEILEKYRDKIKKIRGFSKGLWYEHDIFHEQEDIKGDRNADELRSDSFITTS